MNFQWAQNWLFPLGGSEPHPLDRTHLHVYRQDGLRGYPLLQPPELWEDRQTPQAPTSHPKALTPSSKVGRGKGEL